MGCAPSKIEATPRVDVYRPAPTSFAVFDINSIEEPWVVNKAAEQRISKSNNDEVEKQQTIDNNMPAPILEKLKTFEIASEAPRSWDEVSKALEDLKPTLHSKPAAASPPINNNQQPAPPTLSSPYAGVGVDSPPLPKLKRKSFSFHTLEELENKQQLTDEKPASASQQQMKKTESMSEFRSKSSSTSTLLLKFKNHESRLVVEESNKPRAVDAAGLLVKPITENVFLLRDRLEREKEGKEAKFEKMRRDPLADYPEKCPPGGSNCVVLYTTSLRGVRRTFEDCNRVKTILEIHRVVFDERDVSLHGEFLNELKETLLLGSDETMMISFSVPRVFVKGRYIGGAEEVVELNESGRLGRILNSARIERGVGRQACEGCGGARFVPCLDCGGSCKLVVGDRKERCPNCNENGLAHCPACV